jgi:hypothetical protein
MAPAPCSVQLWIVDADCACYDSAPTTLLEEPPSLHVPTGEPTMSIAMLRQFFTDASDLLTDVTEARMLIRTELNVKTADGGQLNSGLVDCGEILDFVSKDFVRRFSLLAHNSKVKTRVRLASGQRLTSSIVCETTFELA